MNQTGILKRYQKIVFIFLLGQIIATLYLFSMRGFDITPMVGFDSFFYIDSAERFPDLLPKQRNYLGMAIIVKFASLIGPTRWIFVILNSIAAIVSGEFLWQITKKYSSNFCAWIAVYVWLLNPLTAQWTRWLMTETLYFSAVIIWLWIFIFRRSFLLFLFSALATTLRPNAFTLLVSAVICSCVIKQKLNFRKVLILTSLCILVFSILIYYIFGSYDGAKNYLIESFSEGEVIWNMPETFIEYSTSPFYYINLFFRRIGWELIQVRPWYSFKNNFFITIFMSSFYILSIRGAWFIRKSKLLKAITFITVTSLIVIGVTWSIYEGRFGWWFLVSWIPLVAIGTQSRKKELVNN